MKTLLTLLFIFIGVFATQWQPAALIPPGSLAINGPSFTNDNQTIYCSIFDPYYFADIAYYHWDGIQWSYIGKIQGDVNTTAQEEEPWVTFDGQKLYFMRSIGSTGTRHLWMATWDGAGFNNSTELNSQINSADCRDPSITQDGLKLYFSRGTVNGRKIYESTWSGSDWGTPVMLPYEVNGNDNHDKDNVTISPDGTEIYFTGAGSYYNRLSFSKKISGVWQQWAYCDLNINLSGCTVSNEALTYAPYETQELYFARNYSPGTLTWHAFRSPVAVEPVSIGQIKANYR